MRSFLLLLGFILATYHLAEAQQPPKIPRVGYLASFGAPYESPAKYQVAAFREGLKSLGFDESKNILVDYRHPEESVHTPELAAELLRLKVDVLVAVDPTAIRAAKQA